MELSGQGNEQRSFVLKSSSLSSLSVKDHCHIGTIGTLVAVINMRTWWQSLLPVPSDQRAGGCEDETEFWGPFCEWENGQRVESASPQVQGGAQDFLITTVS